MSKPRKPYVEPKITELELTPELERLFKPGIIKYYLSHPEKYHPKYNPTGREGAPSNNGDANDKEI